MIELPSTFSLRAAGALMAAALAVGWIGRGALDGAPAGASVTVFDTWRLACPPRTQDKASCEITQDVVEDKTGATLLRIAVSANEEDPVIDVVVPHNVLLPKGVGLKVGNGDMKTFPYRTCNALGCIATIKPDAALYSAMLHSGNIAVSFANLAGQPVARQLEAKGFDDAVAAMKSAETKRHSWIRRVLL